MNRVLRIDEEKPEMHISVQGYINDGQIRC